MPLDKIASGAKRVRMGKRLPDSLARLFPRKVLVVGDRSRFSEVLLHTLKTDPDLKLCGELLPARGQMLGTIRSSRPEILIIGAKQDGAGEVGLLKRLRTLDSAIKVVVISSRAEASQAERFIRAGANGFVLRQEGLEAVIEAVADVLAGYLYVSEAVLFPAPKIARKARG